MALRNIGTRRTGRMPSFRWEGGRDDPFNLSSSGYRAGQVIDGNGEPVGGILIGCLYIPTRRIVGHTVSAQDGSYYFGGLRADVSDYFFFAYPDAALLGDDYDFATRYLLS